MGATSSCIPVAGHTLPAHILCFIMTQIAHVCKRCPRPEGKKRFLSSLHSFAVFARAALIRWRPFLLPPFPFGPAGLHRACSTRAFAACFHPCPWPVGRAASKQFCNGRHYLFDDGLCCVHAKVKIQFIAPCVARVADSYTHLDVYKRQR